MTGDRLPRVRPDGAEISRRATPPVGASPGRPRVYGAAPLEFSDQPDRDECWAMLNPAVSAQLRSAAGEVIEWWAIRNDVGRVQAVVLGTDALVVARPTLSQDGRHVYKLRTYPVLPGSFRFVTVREPESVGRRVAGPPPERSALPSGPAPLELPGLGDRMRTFLGNLPERAQTYLQEPFVGAGRTVDGDFYYLREEGRDAIDLAAWCFLTDRRTLTFASGHRTSRYGIPQEAGGWDLVCRQARIGRGAPA